MLGSVDVTHQDYVRHCDPGAPTAAASTSRAWRRLADVGTAHSWAPDVSTARRGRATPPPASGSACATDCSCLRPVERCGRTLPSVHRPQQWSGLTVGRWCADGGGHDRSQRGQGAVDVAPVAFRAANSTLAVPDTDALPLSLATRPRRCAPPACRRRMHRLARVRPDIIGFVLGALGVLVRSTHGPRLS